MSSFQYSRRLNVRAEHIRCPDCSEEAPEVFPVYYNPKTGKEISTQFKLSDQMWLLAFLGVVGTIAFYLLLRVVFMVPDSAVPIPVMGVPLLLAIGVGYYLQIRNTVQKANSVRRDIYYCLNCRARWSESRGEIVRSPQTQVEE
jgi:hypothetical protein